MTPEDVQFSVPQKEDNVHLSKCNLISNQSENDSAKVLLVLKNCSLLFKENDVQISMHPTHISYLESFVEKSKLDCLDSDWFNGKRFSREYLDSSFIPIDDVLIVPSSQIKIFDDFKVLVTKFPTEKIRANVLLSLDGVLFVKKTIKLQLSVSQIKLKFISLDTKTSSCLLSEEIKEFDSGNFF